MGDRAEEISVRTPSDSSLCGAHFEINQSYFVAASQFSDGSLHTNTCDQICVTRENSLSFLDPD